MPGIYQVYILAAALGRHTKVASIAFPLPSAGACDPIDERSFQGGRRRFSKGATSLAGCRQQQAGQGRSTRPEATTSHHALSASPPSIGAYAGLAIDGREVSGPDTAGRPHGEVAEVPGPPRPALKHCKGAEVSGSPRRASGRGILAGARGRGIAAFPRSMWRGYRLGLASPRPALKHGEGLPCFRAGCAAFVVESMLRPWNAGSDRTHT